MGAYSAGTNGLVRFLRDQVGRWFENRYSDLERRPLFQSQAYGEGARWGSRVQGRLAEVQTSVRSVRARRMQGAGERG